MGEDPPSALISKRDVWGLSKYSHGSNTQTRIHQIMWIGSSTSEGWRRHGIPTCPRTSSQVGSPACMNQWWYEKMILVQSGYFPPGSPIPLGISGTPYAVPCQWWNFLLVLLRGRIYQRIEGSRSLVRTMEQLGAWWCGWQRNCLEQGRLWWWTVAFVCWTG